MSQVDDWSDGYTSDYLRDLNTYGPASANVPRPSSVVSHQVRYRAPDTSDIPLAPGQNPEGSVYSNASGARMGQTKPRSGYNPPAGGGYTAQTFPHETAGRRYAPAKKPAQVAKKSAVKKTAVKKQSQAEYHTGGALTQDESNVAGRAASHRQSDLDWGELNGQALDAAARFLPALRLLSGFGAGAGAEQSSTDIPETNFNRGLMGGVGRQAEAIRKPAPESSSLEGQFKNMPWYEDAKAHHEAVKKNMDDYGSALGTLKSTWDDIPWLTKLLMLPPVFKAGSPAAGASTTGNVWAEGGRAAAGDATAGAKAFEEALSRMNGGAVRGAPVEGAARRSFSSAGTATGAEAAGTAGREAAAAGDAAAEGSRLYGPLAERTLAPKGPVTGGASGARTTLTSADEGLPVGYSLLRESPKGTSAWRGAAADYGVSPAGGSVKLDLNGMPGAAGRSSVDEAMRVAENLDELVRSIESGTVDEMGKAWIEAMANQKAAGFGSETIDHILALARAAGVIK